MPYRPSFTKRLLAKPSLRLVLTLIASLLLRLIFCLSRVTQQIAPEAAPYASGAHPAIFCFWHGRMILMPFFKPPGRRSVALISQHRDGAVITDMLRRFGIATVRGSSSKGGSKALRGLMEAAQWGDNLCITPDGPRGPYQIAAPGTIWLAQATGLPIVPVSFSASRRRHARSWDKFLFPLPFGHIFVIAGAPITVSPDADAEKLAASRELLENRLRELTFFADETCTRSA
jgi:hypothetical protein